MASPKQLAREVLDSLPDDCSLHEIQYRLPVRLMVEEGREDVRRGNVVSQEEIEQDLEALARAVVWTRRARSDLQLAVAYTEERKYPR